MYGIRRVSEDVRSRLLQQEVCRMLQYNLWGKTAEVRDCGGAADGVYSGNSDRRRKCLVYRP
jgi:hypothetical protein